MMCPARIGAAFLIAFALTGCEGEADGHLYIASGQSDEVIRLRAHDGSVVRRIPVDRLRVETDEPHAVAVAPDGRHWYVTVAHGVPTLWKFETAGDRLVGRVELPSGAAMIGFGADGAAAFVPDYDRAGDRVGHVAAVRLHDLHVLGHAEACVSPHEAAAHPAGDLIAVACTRGNEVVLMRTSDLSVVRRIPAPSRSAPHDSTGHVATGARPMSAAWSPDGRLLAVALHGADAVWLLDPAGETRALIDIGRGPAQLIFLDDRRLVSANRMDGTMSVVDVEEQREVRRVILDALFPHGLAADPSGSTAYVAFEGSPGVDGGVVAVRVETGEVLWKQSVGRYVLAIDYLDLDD